MTSNGRNDDDVSEPEVDAGARAEHAWLIAREADPAAPPPSAKVAAEYAQLEAMLGDVAIDDHDQSWRAEVLRRAHALSAPRRWWRRPAARWALVGAAAAMIALVVLALRPPPSTQLAFHIVPADTHRADPNQAVVGDRFVASLPRGGHDLRLFRPDGHLVAYCPGGPGCSGTELAVKLDAVGMYYLYLVTGNVEIPFDATMSDFADHAANAHVQMRSFSVH
jgi:hypothetical protein